MKRRIDVSAPIPEAALAAPVLERFLQALVRSYENALRAPLLPSQPGALAARLFELPAALLAHDASPDPVYTFGNRRALELWGMSFEEFTAMPSRLCAEPTHRDEREAFLSQVRSKGYVTGYTGVRISKAGQRFRIVDAVCWNVFDQSGQRIGQAASFAEILPLPET